MPSGTARILDPRDVRRLRVRISGADLADPDIRGVGQTVDGDMLDIHDPQQFKPGPADRAAPDYLAPEPLIESDAPEIRTEAETAVRNVTGTRSRAERLTRHVNGILEKKPTISLPSAREVLRIRSGLLRRENGDHADNCPQQTQ